jgi:hypothetical protein
MTGHDVLGLLAAALDDHSQVGPLFDARHSG